MMDYMPDSVLIREDELKVLMAGLGYESVTGLFSDTSEDASVLQVLRGLTEQRQIWSDGEQFHIRPALERMLRGIADAKKIVVIRTREEEQGLCCYCGRELVVSQACAWQTSVLRLSVSTAQELAAALLEKTRDVYESLWGELPSEEQLWSEQRTQVLELSCYTEGVLCQRLEGVCGVLQPPELLLSWPDGSRTALPWTREGLSSQVTQLLGC